MMVRPDRLDIDPQVFTPGHLAVIRDAAQEPSVQRIFVNAAIKKALCREAKGDRGWLSKVRPMYGHDYHFHIRITCPAGSRECESQPAPPDGEGCRPADLAYWFKDSVLHPKPPAKPPKPTAAADAGAIADRLPPRARRAGCQAIRFTGAATRQYRNALVLARHCAVSAWSNRDVGPASSIRASNARHRRARPSIWKEPPCASVHATRSRAPSSK